MVWGNSIPYSVNKGHDGTLGAASKAIERKVRTRKFKDGDIGVIAGSLINPTTGKSSGHIFNFIVDSGQVKFIDGQGGYADAILRKGYKFDSNTELAFAVIANKNEPISDAVAEGLMKLTNY